MRISLVAGAGFEPATFGDVYKRQAHEVAFRDLPDRGRKRELSQGIEAVRVLHAGQGFQIFGKLQLLKLTNIEESLNMPHIVR